MSTPSGACGSYVAEWDAGRLGGALRSARLALYLLPRDGRPHPDQFLLLGHWPGREVDVVTGHCHEHDGLLRLVGRGVTIREGTEAAAFRDFEHYLEPLPDGTLIGCPMAPGWLLLSAHGPYAHLGAEEPVPFEHPELTLTWPEVEEAWEAVWDAEEGVTGPQYLTLCGVLPDEHGSYCRTSVHHPNMTHPLRRLLDRVAEANGVNSAAREG